MSAPQRTILITGCSTNGLGHGLAMAMQARGLRVFATARNPDKMTGLAEKGIETLTLDVLSADSINACVDEVRRRTSGTLDILINNAGGGYNMPVSDIDVAEAKKLFDLNVWSYITVTQAFLPLLLASAKKDTTSPSRPTMIVNNTSVSSVEPTPHNSVYNASKAAVAMFSDHMRLEFQPFGISVVDLKTGCVHTNFHANHQDGLASLPSTSIYMPVKEETEQAMRGSAFSHREGLETWSRNVVDDLLRRRPRAQIWRGLGAWKTWFVWTFFSNTWFDESWRRLVGLDLLRGRLSRGRVGDV